MGNVHDLSRDMLYILSKFLHSHPQQSYLWNGRKDVCMLEDVLPMALTFDDVLLLPGHSTVLPDQVNLHTRLTNNIRLSIPLVSAAMDTVTEAKTAIAMAVNGGLGIIHKNMSISSQVQHVQKVKRAMTGIVRDPVTISPQMTLETVRFLMQEHNISGMPVVEQDKLVGILTDRDMRFEKNWKRLVSEVMTQLDDLVTCTPDDALDLDKAKDIMQKHKIEKLLVVGEKGDLQGLITFKDLQVATQHPQATRDNQGRLRCGAAIGATGDYIERAETLLQVGADVLVIDTAHGHSENVLQAMRNIRAKFPQASIIVGNVATAEATQACIEAGADAVKVGIGPGSICTTRVVAGVGVPQLTAISECSKITQKYGIPLIADGGVKYSGDIAKAIAAGADVVMMGSLFAGTDEAPGEIVLYQGRSYKTYRGMGSVDAMQAGSKDRYFQDARKSTNKLVPEGIVGRVPYRGSLSDNIYQMTGGLRSAMGYTGCGSIEELQKKSRFTRITSAGLKESHVHDVIITQESPNYHMH